MSWDDQKTFWMPPKHVLDIAILDILELWNSDLYGELMDYNLLSTLWACLGVELFMPPSISM